MLESGKFYGSFDDAFQMFVVMPKNKGGGNEHILKCSDDIAH